MPVTLTVTNGTSTKSFKFSKCKLKKVSFFFFFESISVSEFLEIERKGFHALGPDNEKVCSPNFSFNCGSSYRKLLEDLSM